jgi:hypothetical protein
MQKISLHRNYQKPSRLVGWLAISLNCLFNDSIAMGTEPQSGDDGV